MMDEFHRRDDLILEGGEYVGLRMQRDIAGVQPSMECRSMNDWNGVSL